MLDAFEEYDVIQKQREQLFSEMWGFEKEIFRLKRIHRRNTPEVIELFNKLEEHSSVIKHLKSKQNKLQVVSPQDDLVDPRLKEYEVKRS